MKELEPNKITVCKPLLRECATRRKPENERRLTHSINDLRSVELSRTIRLRLQAYFRSRVASSRLERYGEPLVNPRLGAFFITFLKMYRGGMPEAPSFWKVSTDSLGVVHEDDVIVKDMESSLKATTWKRVHQKSEVVRDCGISVGEVIPQNTDIQIEKTHGRGTKVPVPALVELVLVKNVFVDRSVVCCSSRHVWKVAGTA